MLHHSFAITAPGLEAIAAAELRALGLGPATPETGGVAFQATAGGLYAANLRLRTASRVIVRVAEFPARAFHELERRAARVPWERFVAPGAPAAFRVTCRKSRLYHSDAVAQRLHAAAARAGAIVGVAAMEEGEDEAALRPEGAGAQLFVVRLLHDVVTISADSSGALLHRRGYRQAIGRAPLRETLAAAMLLASGWRPDRPLVDPLCGSGTIAIEAALLARRIAPGLRREFAFQRWPEFDAGVWAGEVARAESEALDAAPAPIVGSDRDAGAVAAAVANAERAGVAADLLLVQRSLSALEPPPGPGWLVTNPPWGARVGEAERLRDLYARLGQVARTRCPGWTVALLSADPRLESQTGLPLAERFRTTAGGLRVRLMAGVA